ncbi:hypothetical protein HJFPF1_10137 [Paramyrothecium foliicola]|nr:hypothetical protein HJFPF1_10137 [Paramyrothecium foliicola]
MDERFQEKPLRYGGSAFADQGNKTSNNAPSSGGGGRPRTRQVKQTMFAAYVIAKTFRCLSIVSHIACLVVHYWLYRYAIQKHVPSRTRFMLHAYTSIHVLFVLGIPASELLLCFRPASHSRRQRLSRVADMCPTVLCLVSFVGYEIIRRSHGASKFILEQAYLYMALANLVTGTCLAFGKWLEESEAAKIWIEVEVGDERIDLEKYSSKQDEPGASEADARSRGAMWSDQFHECPRGECLHRDEQKRQQTRDAADIALSEEPTGFFATAVVFAVCPVVAHLYCSVANYHDVRAGSFDPISQDKTEPFGMRIMSFSLMAWNLSLAIGIPASETVVALRPQERYQRARLALYSSGAVLALTSLLVYMIVPPAGSSHNGPLLLSASL